MNVAPGHVNVLVEFVKKDVETSTFGILLIFEILYILPADIFPPIVCLIVNVVEVGMLFTTTIKFPNRFPVVKLVITYNTSPTERFVVKDAPGHVNVNGELVLNEHVDGVIVGTVVICPLLKILAF